MVSLGQNRNNNVYDEVSTDDSDYEYRSQSGKRSNVDNLSRLNSSSMPRKRAKVAFQFTSSEYDKMSQNTRTPKCFSRNALMARENRIKKKIYVQNLEETVEKYRDENKKLSSILDNQSNVITDLRKEVKYLKNVLANSSDIGRLLKAINQNTGMPVTTSVNNNMKFEAPIKKVHPWAEEQQPISGILCDFDELNVFPEVPVETLDHTYTNSLRDTEDVGVCLHIAKHKVSLEFCSSCSENASSAWSED